MPVFWSSIQAEVGTYGDEFTSSSSPDNGRLRLNENITKHMMMISGIILGNNRVLSEDYFKNDTFVLLHQI